MTRTLVRKFKECCDRKRFYFVTKGRHFGPTCLWTHLENRERETAEGKGRNVFSEGINGPFSKGNKLDTRRQHLLWKIINNKPI